MIIFYKNNNNNSWHKIYLIPIQSLQVKSKHSKCLYNFFFFFIYRIHIGMEIVYKTVYPVLQKNSYPCCSNTCIRCPRLSRVSNSSNVLARPLRGVVPRHGRWRRAGRSTSSSTRMNLKWPTRPSTQPFQRPEGFLAMMSIISSFCKGINAGE